MLIHQLGKRAPRFDPRTLRFAKYRTSPLPPLPPEISWVTHVPSWGMMLNDFLGDCVVAAMGHSIQQWTQYANPPEVILPDETILKGYEILGGYVPGQPATDNGVVMLDALNFWRKDGLGLHKILAYVQVDTRNLQEVREAVYLFGNLFTGLALPSSAAGMDDWTVADGGVWTPGGAPGSWGGHCLDGDTEVPLLRGSSARIRDLVGQDEVWLYSCGPHGSIRPGRAHSIRRTGEGRDILRIVLDDGSSLRLTPDHRVMLRNGSYCEAGSLVPGDSVMPLYRRRSLSAATPGYEEVYNPGTGQWRLTHRMVASALHCLHRGEVVHHEDFKKLNNDPANLRVMSWDDHTALHARHPVGEGILDYATSETGRRKSRELMNALWADPVWAENQRAKLRASAADRGAAACKTRRTDYLHDLGKAAYARNLAHRSLDEQRLAVARLSKDDVMGIRQAYASGVTQSSLAGTYGVSRSTIGNIALGHTWKDVGGPVQAVNHKVVAIERHGSEEVFDLAVDGYHNFAISPGVFVHNCVPVMAVSQQTLTCITWGQRLKMSHNFFTNYADEAYAVLSEDWLAAVGGGVPASPAGFNVQQLMDDLNQL